MLNLSAAIALGRTSGAYKQGGDPATRLLEGVVQTALALVLYPLLLIAVIVAGVHAAADWCALRIMAAIRGDERFLYQPMWSRFELLCNDSRALRGPCAGDVDAPRPEFILKWDHRDARTIRHRPADRLLDSPTGRMDQPRLPGEHSQGITCA